LSSWNFIIKNLFEAPEKGNTATNEAVRICIDVIFLTMVRSPENSCPRFWSPPLQAVGLCFGEEPTE
jgi:hypothetical protein